MSLEHVKTTKVPHSIIKAAAFSFGALEGWRLRGRRLQHQTEKLKGFRTASARRDGKVGLSDGRKRRFLGEILLTIVILCFFLGGE